MKKIDLAGKKIGRLTALTSNGSSKNGHILWKCRCDCGKIVTVFGSNLIKGFTKSCGCLKSEVTKQRMTIHGEMKTKLYRVWRDIIDRCTKPYCKIYPNYGGRGISLCNEWMHHFKPFRDWAISNGYQEGLTIDRINVNGNYEPANCRWITNAEQQTNKRNNHFLNVDGKKLALSVVARMFNIPYGTFWCWVKKYGANTAITMAKQKSFVSDIYYA